MDNSKTLHQKCYRTNKWTYITFILISIVFICIKDFSNAFIFGGLALAFDPFDQNRKFQDRPKYQQFTLYVHTLVLVLAFVVYLIFTFKK